MYHYKYHLGCPLNFEALEILILQLKRNVILSKKFGGRTLPFGYNIDLRAV